MAEHQPGPDEPSGFLSRWSRRKALVREGQTLPEPVVQPVVKAPAAAPLTAAVPAAAQAGLSPDETPAVAPVSPAVSSKAPQPTLEDVENLTPQSDFSAFTRPQVDPEVRNAAMKKLFHGDPHFNVMDGLDVYIGDYNTPDPLPRSIMLQMMQARSLGLLDDELTDQDKPEPDGPGEASPAPDTAHTHENADLQLQPDDAAGREGADAGAVEPGPGEPVGDGLEPPADDEPRLAP